MTLKREDIKKLVIQQMLQESVQEEGAVTNWLRQKASSGLSKVGKAATDLGQKITPKPEEDPEFLRDLSKIADFIQMHRDSKVVTDSDFYKKFVMGMQEQVNEQYESQFLKQILSKKPTVADVEKFTQSISGEPSLMRDLKTLQLKKINVFQPQKRTVNGIVVQPPVEGPEKSSSSTTQAKTEPASSAPKTATSDTAPAGQKPTTTAIAASSEIKATGTKVETPNSTINVKPAVPRGQRSQAGRAKRQKSVQDAVKEAEELADLLKRHESVADLNPSEKTKLVQLLLKKPETQPSVKAEQLQEAIVEEIFNLLTGKIK